MSDKPKNCIQREDGRRSLILGSVAVYYEEGVLQVEAADLYNAVSIPDGVLNWLKEGDYTRKVTLYTEKGEGGWFSLSLSDLEIKLRDMTYEDFGFIDFGKGLTIQKCGSGWLVLTGYFDEDGRLESWPFSDVLKAVQESLRIVQEIA